jgi:hypothetical protein
MAPCLSVENHLPHKHLVNKVKKTIVKLTFDSFDNCLVSHHLIKNHLIDRHFVNTVKKTIVLVKCLSTKDMAMASKQQLAKCQSAKCFLTKRCGTGQLSPESNFRVKTLFLTLSNKCLTVKCFLTKRCSTRHLSPESNLSRKTFFLTLSNKCLSEKCFLTKRRGAGQLSPESNSITKSCSR